MMMDEPRLIPGDRGGAGGCGEAGAAGAAGVVGKLRVVAFSVVDCNLMLGEDDSEAGTCAPNEELCLS